MNKLIIIGNSGSGKSWLARELSISLSLPHLELDKVFWEPGGCNKKRAEFGVNAELSKAEKQTSWVVEGVFGHLVKKLLPLADTLIFLDMPWLYCKESLLGRGSERSKQQNIIDAERNFSELLVWASEYDTRDSMASKKYHQELYAEFTGSKYRFTSRREINRFSNEVRC